MLDRLWVILNGGQDEALNYLVEGMKDLVEGMKDILEGMKDQVEGMKDMVEGMKDQVVLPFHLPPSASGQTPKAETLGPATP